MSIKSSVGSIIKNILPGYYWARKMSYYKQHFSEVEMKLLPYLCKKDKTSLDIGAAGGVFIANMLGVSKNVIAFEPIPADAAILKTMVEATKSNVKIECVALSDKSGEATLRMMANDLGRSTIEESNTLDDHTGSLKTGIKVPIKKLDDFIFNNIGFIKIDVEGHELSVLRGSKETIRRNLPALLIEIEDRHKLNAVADVPLFLKEFGYLVYFILDGKLTPISDFNKTTHQNSSNIGTYTDGYVRKGVYINNFIFIPPAEVSKFLSDAAVIFPKK
ncbi:MAG: FkbM family methyltransferase [Ferruginibacter sp.]|nr:FkbM family methyltransferase [Ferruginibacter sp.]